MANKNRTPSVRALEDYMRGLVASLGSSIADMLPRRATPADRERIDALIDSFHADLIEAAVEIGARARPSRKPRKPRLRLIAVDGVLM